jgi:hypothetical protein
MTNLQSFLKKLKATPKVAKAAGLRHLSDSEARGVLDITGTGVIKRDYSGIAFPGYDLRGQPHDFFQIRRDHPDTSASGKPEAKYMSPKGSEGRYLYCLPGADKRLKDHKVVLVESPKSVIAIESFAERTGQKITAVATNGCNGWKRRIDDDHSVPLEDLALLEGRDVLVNLDANVETNGDVRAAEKALCEHLMVRVRARSVRCVRLAPEDGVNGPDDYLAKKSDKAYGERLKDAQEPWRYGKMFATFEAMESAKEPDFLIQSVLQDAGITFIGGLSGHGKTWLLLSIIKALLSGQKLFDYYAVTRTVPRVLYLSPEVQLGQVKTRLQRFSMMEFVKDGRLLVRSLSEGIAPRLIEPDILMAARGAVVILDTAVRFMEGKENDSDSNRDGLSAKCFGLLEAGAITVVASHHSPKGLEGAENLSLQNVMRGSGDIGAMLSGAWGVYQTDQASNSIYVANLKPRDQDPFEPFVIAGRPFINEKGDFRVTKPPGIVGSLGSELPQKPKGGRQTAPENTDKITYVAELVNGGEQSPAKVAAKINEKFGTKHNRETASKWMRKANLAKKMGD